MSDENQLPPSAAAPSRPRPVIPPYPLRVAAYLIDIVVLYFLGYTLETFLREPLLSLGPLLPFLSTLAMFLYFWLGNGPVGGGATFGKSILNMRTIRMNGAPPGWGDSLRRTLLHFPPVYTATFLLFRDGLMLPELWTSPVGALLSTFSIFLFAVNGFAMLVHPYRRGLHDLASEVIVTSDPTPPEFAEVRATLADESFRRQLRSQRKVVVFFGAVIVCILGAQWVMALLSPRVRADMRAVDVFNRELDLGEYRISQVVVPSLEDAALFQRTLKNLAAHPTAGGDLPTTDTLRRGYWKDGRTAIIRLHKRFGALHDDEIRSAAFMAKLEEVRRVWGRLAVPQGWVDPPSHPEPDRMIISLADPFQFAFFPPRQGQLNAWFAEGPADPARGGFRLEKINFEKEAKPAPDKPAN